MIAKVQVMAASRVVRLARSKCGAILLSYLVMVTCFADSPARQTVVYKEVDGQTATWPESVSGWNPKTQVE